MKRNVFQALQVRKSVCCRHDIQHDYVTDDERGEKRLQRAIETLFYAFLFTRSLLFPSLDDY
jgi:hypothetical protein